MEKFWNILAGRSILVGLAVILFAITAIGVGGMVTSMLVAEQVQGSGSAINVAGSLRRLSHRMGSIVLSDAENRVSDHRRLRAAIEHFEKTLHHQALASVMERNPESHYAHTYQAVRGMWNTFLKPLLNEEALPGADLHAPERHNELMAAIDAFVDNINNMVAQLEDETENNVRQLRSILVVALLLTIAVMIGAILAVHRGVLSPLANLTRTAARIAGGDFSARARHTGRDELGQVGQSFNMMAEELSKLYQDLEQRVADKTLELTRSNRSLELLYHSIARLYNAPVAPATYQAILHDMEQVLGLTASLACLLPRHGDTATTLANNLGRCEQLGLGNCQRCGQDQGTGKPWSYQSLGHQDVLTVPLRDAEQTYGMLRLAMPAGHRIEPWQSQLLEALSRHIGIAMGISHKTEQERLLALQEERSIIARELHDSLAQSLSYMKIQASLMQPMLTDQRRLQEAEHTLLDLREGITSAYRQLRELLATFRLRMEGDFIQLLERTVEEYGARGGLNVQLETRLDGCYLSANQEIHILHIIREALSNVLRHAAASHAWVGVRHEGGGMVTVTIEDDGRGLDLDHVPKPHHYGLSIMRERAGILHGELAVTPRPAGGTHVRLRFRTQTLEQPNTTTLIP